MIASVLSTGKYPSGFGSSWLEMTENEHKCIGKTYLVLCIFLVLGTILYFWILRKILSEELQTSALHSIGIEFLHKAYEHVRHLSVLFMKELFLIFNNIEHFSVLYILHLFWSCVMGLGSCSLALWWNSIPILRRIRDMGVFCGWL